MATKKINIGVVGSTGSVGKTSLKIFQKYKKQFNIELLVCDQNLKEITNQIKAYSPKYVFVNNSNVYNSVKLKKFKTRNKNMIKKMEQDIPLQNLSKKWIFQIDIGNEKLYANLEDGKVFHKNPDKKKYIIKLKTSRNIIRCIMQKKIHLNNAIVGNYLSWERKPNIYNKYLWDMFSFFQAPLKKIGYSS